MPENEDLTEIVEDLYPAPTIIIPKKNVILDSQLLSTLMSCGRLFDFKFNMHLVSIRGKNESLEMGLIVHKFLETYYRGLIQGLSKSQSEGQAHIVATDYSQSPEITNTPLEDREWAITTCHQYLEYYRNDFWTPLEVETVKSHFLYEDDEIRVLWKAKLDLTVDTNQGIYPIDHKSMKQRRDTISLNNQFMGQCITMGTRKMFVNKVGFQTSLKPADRFTRVEVSYTADRLHEWQYTIVPYWAKTLLVYQETGYYPPNFTHCDKYFGCIMREVCESNRNMREEVLGNNFVVGEQWDVTNE